MSITTPFRRLARSLVLDAGGRFAAMSRSVHILNGHVIGDRGEQSKDAFRRLLQELAQTARLTRIEEACELIGRKVDLDRPHIAFTFDDGFIDCHETIAPALEECGINAAFFINPHFVDGDPEYCTQFYRRAVPSIRPRAPMSRDMVRDLCSRGHVIGAHTTDHVRMNVSDDATIDGQIVGCKPLVEAISGAPCDWFAWTYGKFPDISEKALAKAIDSYALVFSSDGYGSYYHKSTKVLNRRHFECDWPAAHVKFFLRTKRSHVIAA